MANAELERGLTAEAESLAALVMAEYRHLRLALGTRDVDGAVAAATAMVLFARMLQQVSRAVGDGAEDAPDLALAEDLLQPVEAVRDWAAESESHTMVTNNIGPLEKFDMVRGVDRRFVFRHLDPARMVFHHQGRTLALADVVGWAERLARHVAEAS